MFCRRCGEVLNETSKYCPKCGQACVCKEAKSQLDNTLKKNKKRLAVIILCTVLGIGIVLFVGLNVLVQQSKEGKYFITKELANGDVEKYKLISLNESILYSRLTKEGTNTIETFFDESGEMFRRFITSDSGKGMEVYYLSKQDENNEQEEYIRKYYTKNGELEAIAFRLTDKYLETEDTTYDLIRDSIPATVYPGIEYDGYERTSSYGEKIWQFSVLDLNGNVIKYCDFWIGNFDITDIYESGGCQYKYDEKNILTEITEGTMTLQYYASGKIKSEYHDYDPSGYEDLTGKKYKAGLVDYERIMYYENGMVALRELIGDEDLVLYSCEYDERGAVAKTMERERYDSGIVREDIKYADGSSEYALYDREDNGSLFLRCRIYYDMHGREIKVCDYDESIARETEETEYFDNYDFIKEAKKRTVSYKDGTVEVAEEGTLEELEGGFLKVVTNSFVLSSPDKQRYSETIYNNTGEKVSCTSYCNDILVSEMIYNGDELIGLKSFSDDGEPIEEYTIENGIKKAWKYNDYDNEGRTVYREQEADESENGLMRTVLEKEYNDDGSYVMTKFNRGGEYRTSERIWYNADGSVEKREEYAYMDEGASLSGTVGYAYQREYDRDDLKEERGTIIYTYNGENQLVKTDVWTREGHGVFY